MKKKLLLFLIPFLFFGYIIFHSGCKDKITNPPEENPPGYQEDIVWPSLADSPWPTTNHDMQRTGRSQFVGPQQGVIVSKVRAIQLQGGIAFANDSVFYFGQSARGIDTTKLVAAKIDGTVLWSLDLKAFETTTTPLVDNNGTIYIANGFYRSIYAVNPDGMVKWEYRTDYEVFNRGLGIGKDGTLYAIDNGSNLIALNRDGTLLWKHQDLNFSVGSRVNLTFSPDGKTLYINGMWTETDKLTLVAFDPNSKSTKWIFNKGIIWNGPMVDSQGNIYLLIGDDSLDQNLGNFYCLDPNGNIKWKYPHPKGDIYVDIDPTIDKEGNIYFATDTLYALTYSGELKWKIGLEGINYSPLICDAQGTVYVGTNKTFYDSKIYSISRDGVIKWIIPITDEFATGECPAITRNGTLVYPTWRSENLFIIK